MLKLLIVDDEPGIRFSVRQVFAGLDTEVYEADSADSGRQMMETVSPDVVLLDIRLGQADGLQVFEQLRRVDPRAVIVFITGHGTADTAIEAMRRGAYDYLVKPLDAGVLRSVVQQGAESARAMRRPALLEQPEEGSEDADLLVGSSASMRSVFKQVGRVAAQPESVLILGEVGTGRELVARAIYQHSHLRENPLMLANCSGRTAQQLDTELFGCEPGAYPGAERRRIGKLEQASGGTLILDEVTELPLETQAKLLRFLEQSQFERLGGSETLTCPVRILAITQPALEQLVESGKFRRDLYFRLRGLTISLPPLRERRQDIPELAHYFMFRFNRSLATTVHSISEEVLERFDLYGWPGNVRELRNCIRESLVRSSGPVLAEEFLPGELTRQTPEAETEAIEVSADVAADWSELAQQVESGLQARERGLYRRVLRLFDRILVRGALQQTEGNQAVAAELLGLSRPTLRGKIRNMRSAAGSS
ncbi:MAG: sigma-54-dependent transcriptional regulator [Planctomycetaceae bacterium]|jgi:two-component system nitrogen regulation response regulator GlnG